MRNYYFLIILFLITLSDKVLGINQGDLIKFHLKVQDVIEGEIPFGAAKLFELIIENNGLDSVKLATSNVSPWMVYSGFWKVHIEGPVDERCKEYISYSVDEPGIGEVPCIEIPGKSKKEFQLSLVGVGGVGVYKVRVEYNGKGVPWEGCFHGVIRSSEYTFQIKEPEGVDREIFDLWQRQNPESPPCLFPRNMEKELLDPKYILTHFPTSTYAGWVLLKLPHAGWGTRDKKYDEEKKRYQELVEMFLEVHPDFPYAAYLAADAGYIALEYNNYKSACQLFKKAMELTTVIELTEKTKKMYNELKKEGKCK